MARGAYGIDGIPGRHIIAEKGAEILRRAKVEEAAPVPYKQLAWQVERSLGWSPNGDIDTQREARRQFAEDLRQAADEGTHGLCYVGDQVCRIALQSWFPGCCVGEKAEIQGRFFDENDCVCIPIDIDAGHVLDAAEVAYDLHLKLVNKYGSTRRDVYRRSLYGMTVQMPISEWFRERYQEAWLEPTNAGVDRPAADDFRLVIDGRVLLVDIAGPWKFDRDRFGDVPGKMQADVHLLARLSADRKHLELVGWCFGGEYRRDVKYAAFSRSMVRLMVELNCHKHNIKHASFIAACGARISAA